jgi:hypothetical protein
MSSAQRKCREIVYRGIGIGKAALPGNLRPFTLPRQPAITASRTASSAVRVVGIRLHRWTSPSEAKESRLFHRLGGVDSWPDRLVARDVRFIVAETPQRR